MNGHKFDETLYDAEQIKLMEERLIVLDKDDNPIGEDSKKTCHLMQNILPPRSLLHRAFSCFLFRPSDGRLLLQQRAQEKITFPLMWTNTCCSHPLAIKQEMEAQDVVGVRRAVRRKLDHELGIKPDSINLDELLFITRIHYLAPSDGLWGEHEIDYVVFATADVELEVNPNEVADTRWVSKAELEDFFKDSSVTFTPWFKLIAQSFLYKWWDALLAQTAKQSSKLVADTQALRPLVTQQDQSTIHRLAFDDLHRAFVSRLTGEPCSRGDIKRVFADLILLQAGIKLVRYSLEICKALLLWLCEICDSDGRERGWYTVFRVEVLQMIVAKFARTSMRCQSLSVCKETLVSKKRG
ncbi:uncharacterized protein L969DRAFT_47516 [Mixia osmundae IAM 14324]|uniref:isopentenyl-diphosphate Delta-isomerase n=1 Tax=Mixia osmundae (strain CBS 9802 / IAM 14324 / JCM 22182 / KY 12970) TaxID=764103 RepID=G7E8T0_MIXOS|nr:uncharacterized protein L969DRAFT_47516 [Mixia osmundae IAM 14324]KEI40184.1 hypothetical protein L969DRAFT_47516 [Mixia osmundae IAM 14324]GAA99548.1 hypothetical protein E5Q_06249 [Mixia osmundae IAM 14324]